jgi:hypothetical protein
LPGLVVINPNAVAGAKAVIPPPQQQGLGRRDYFGEGAKPNVVKSTIDGLNDPIGAAAEHFGSLGEVGHGLEKRHAKPREKNSLHTDAYGI